MKIGILFDLDGTLLDTLEDLYASINHVLSKLGYPQRTREEVRSFVGNGARRLMEQAIPEGANVDEALEAFLTHYNATCNGATCPYPGIPEALKKLGEKYPLAVVSNKPDSAVKPLCAHYFPGLIALGFTEGCPRKPAPDMVYKVLKEMDADTCVYVGDSEVDVLTAKNAGVPCLSVLWGFRDKEEIEEAGGKVFCTDPTEMPAILEDMIKALQS
ncbi:MAG: HAD-IA family hydrolase [Oscillospiraceae bacterium]|nr:HAD-IA family hydrolase [Oscillospiraceae bacterium]